MGKFKTAEEFVPIVHQKLLDDRYIVIDYNTDNEQFYHCGASSKDGGNKVTTITAVADNAIYHPIIDSIANNQEFQLS